jgi:hypothetical protein
MWGKMILIVSGPYDLRILEAGEGASKWEVVYQAVVSADEDELPASRKPSLGTASRVKLLSR